MYQFAKSSVFLGDAVVNFIISDELFHRFPTAREGQMSRLRARLVKGTTLAEIARELKLGDILRLGLGENKSGGINRDSILADAVEALIGAMFLDAGISACRQRVLDWYADRLEQINLKDSFKDPKTRLQEYLQAQKQPLPDYLTTLENQNNQQVFHAKCQVNLLDNALQGSGSSIRNAEQQAAEKVLAALGVN